MAQTPKRSVIWVPLVPLPPLPASPPGCASRPLPLPRQATPRACLSQPQIGGNVVRAQGIHAVQHSGVMVPPPPGRPLALQWGRRRRAERRGLGVETPRGGS